MASKEHTIARNQFGVGSINVGSGLHFALTVVWRCRGGLDLDWSKVLGLG